MNIRGTISEAVLKEQLLKSSSWIFESPEGGRVRCALEKIMGEVRSAFVLTHTQEQAENIYRVLVNGNLIIGFELPRNTEDDSPVNVLQFSVGEYKKILKGRPSQLKLEIATKLSRVD